MHYVYPGQIPGIISTLSFLVGEGATRIVSSIFVTLARTLTGFALALFVAVVLGYAYTLSSIARDTIRAVNTLVQSVSVLVWIIVFLMLFGVFSPLPSILVAAAVALPILLSSIVTGLETASQRLLELAVMLRAPRWRIYPDFLLPSLLPSLAGAARAALGAALRISVVAEAMGASGGIGYMIENYYSLAEPRGVFAWGLLLVVLMVVLDQLILARLEGWVKEWATMQR